MKSLRDLLLRHAGATIAVIGGGPSRLDDVPRLPAGVVCISANQHGCLSRRCEYIVAGDDIEARLRPFGVPIVAPYRWADYPMSEQPQFIYSGPVGAWVAWLLGARLILLVGMDCYADPRGTYPDGVEDFAPGRERGEYSQLRAWRSAAKSIAAPIRAMSGPLTELFGRWDPDERIDWQPCERHVLLAACAGIRVEILRDHRPGKGRHSFLRGQVLELPRNEAQQLLALRVARRYVEAQA